MVFIGCNQLHWDAFPGEIRSFSANKNSFVRAFEM